MLASYRENCQLRHIGFKFIIIITIIIKTRLMQRIIIVQRRIQIIFRIVIIRKIINKNRRENNYWINKVVLKI